MHILFSRPKVLARVDMENHHSRRYQPARTPPSPRLSRSKSGTPAISLSELHANTSNSSLRLAYHRSKSTTKSRTNKGSGGGNENSNHLFMITSPSTQKKPQSQENKNHSFVKFLQRNQGKSNDHAGMSKMRVTSPSAWALSPGRSSPCSPVPVSPIPGRLKSESSSNGGGVSGVLKYFKQKKVSRVQEEEFHRFRISHNRLLQWRFVNARAEAAMGGVKVVAEEKMFKVWLRIFKLRNSIVERRIQMQSLKHEIKQYQIINPQVCLLKEWGKLETRNSEGVGRLARKLSAISISLPLVHDAKADQMSVNDAMSMAMDVMDSMVEVMAKFFSQVERTCYLLTEFIVMVEQQKEYMEELEKRIAKVASLEAEEKSLRVHLIQFKIKKSGAQGIREDQYIKCISD